MAGFDSRLGRLYATNKLIEKKVSFTEIYILYQTLVELVFFLLFNLRTAKTYFSRHYCPITASVWQLNTPLLCEFKGSNTVPLLSVLLLIYLPSSSLSSYPSSCQEGSARWRITASAGVLMLNSGKKNIWTKQRPAVWLSSKFIFKHHHSKPSPPTPSFWIWK